MYQYSKLSVQIHIIIFDGSKCMWKLTNTAKSACDAPPIMFGTKLLCPGASKIVKCLFSVSKKALPTSTVFPFSLSSKFVSNAHDKYLSK